MKNISNIIRCIMLLAMLAVGGNAWATTYYIDATSYTNAGYTLVMDGSRVEINTGSQTTVPTLSEVCTGIISFESYYTSVNQIKLKIFNGQSYSYPEKNGYTLSTTNTTVKTSGSGSLTLSNVSSYSCGYNISTASSGNHCTFSPTSRSIAAGGSGTFTVTPEAGYKLVSASVTNATCSPTNLNNATTATTITVSNPTAAGLLTVTTAAVTFTINASAGANGSVSPSSQSPVAYNGSTSFTATPSTGYIVDQTNTTFSGTGNLSYSGSSPTTITISDITSEGTLSVAFKSSIDYTPVVNFGDIPKKTVNSIEVNAYVAELSCKTVTAAGFYWGTSIAEAIEHSNTRHFAASSPATIGDLVKGGTFSKTGIDLFNGGAGPITTGTNIFFQAYVTTSDGGGTGYSDVVGFFYNPCQGLSEVSLKPTAVTLAEGYSVELSVVARSAGKSPTYEWYLDKTEGQMAGTPEAIPGADKDTYTFTLNDNNSHNIRVKVTDNTCGTSSWTHDAAGTYNSIVTSAQAVISTAANCKEPEPSDISFVTGSALAAPYQSIHLSVTDNGSSSYDKFKWEVSEGGILSGTSITDAYFRAPESLTKYTITYTAINSHCTNADVSVKKTVEIKVEKPEDGCNNPGE